MRVFNVTFLKRETKINVKILFVPNVMKFLPGLYMASDVKTRNPTLMIHLLHFQFVSLYGWH